MAKPYRLGLDIGTNSIGWCLFRLDADDQITSLMRMGVRIFQDGRNPKNKTSKAVDRRLARQQRRQRERTVQRRHGFLNKLIQYGLLPTDDKARQELVKLDPYALRRQALDEKLPIHAFGRALYHLARKRGFKSSRKALGDAEANKEAGKIASGTQALRERLKAARSRTVGEYLASRHNQRQPVLARPNAKGDYEFYPERPMTLDEFELLWATQRPHWPDILTEDARRALRHFIEYQRPLKEVPAGVCLLESSQPRARRGHPLFSEFRILSDLANLRIVLPDGSERSLSMAERDQCLALMRTREPLTWKALRDLLKIRKSEDDTEPFNLAQSKKKGIPGDKVSLHLSQPSAFGPAWHTMSITDQEAVVESLCLAHDIHNLGERLAQKNIDVNSAQLEIISKTECPDGFADLSLKALEKLVPVMRSGVVRYDQAVTAAGYANHYDSLPDEASLRQTLPYYGEVLTQYTQMMPQSPVADEARFGRLPNPTVHIGLNQLRLLVNALIKRYGKPRQIIVELAREFGMSGQRRNEIENEQRKNEAANDVRRTELRNSGHKVNRENLMRYRLWEELPIMHRVCIYTGRPINQEMLFSDEVEIDHILPFSKSLDDGIGNRVLSFRSANREKGQRDPFEAFGHSPPGFDWSAIQQRLDLFAAQSPTWRFKRRKFLPNALNDFLGDRDFLDRHITDTAYLSRLAKQYLSHICFKHRVWVSSGRLTAMLRGKWDLNDALGGPGKNRNDHRHHAVDAAVIGACDRRTIERLSHAARAFELGRSHRFFEQMGQPFEGFSQVVRETVKKVIVSHKPDRDPFGPLHNDTHYRIASPATAKTGASVVHRVPFQSLSTVADAERIVDPKLREAVVNLLSQHSGKPAAALQAFAEAHGGIRSVRIEETLSVVELPNPHRSFGRAVKTDGNAFVDIVRSARGWTDQVRSRFSHAQDPNQDIPDLVVRLFTGDMVAVEEDGGGLRIFKVQQISKGKVTLVEHHEAGDLRRRNDDPCDSFKYRVMSANTIRERRGRRVTIDPLGFLHDPGFVE